MITMHRARARSGLPKSLMLVMTALAAVSWTGTACAAELKKIAEIAIPGVTINLQTDTVQKFWMKGGTPISLGTDTFSNIQDFIGGRWPDHNTLIDGPATHAFNGEGALTSTVVFHGARSEYSLQSYQGTDGLEHTTVIDQGSAGDGTLDIVNVGTLQFTDHTYTLDGGVLNGAAIAASTGSGGSPESLPITSAGGGASTGAGISGLGTMAVDAGVAWTVADAEAVPNIVNNGTVAIASGGSLDVSSAVDIASTGVFQLMTQGTLELAAMLGSKSAIQFLGSAPTNKLIIDSSEKFGTNVGTSSYAGPLLEDFAAGDMIDIRGIGITGLALNYSAAAGDLQITGSGGKALATLGFQNASLGAGMFHTAADGFGGVLITHS